MINLIVASKNPVKIKSTASAFKKMFPEIEFNIKGISIPSGVADQPLTNEETKRGAINRAIKARQGVKEADYWIGIEGGIQPIHDNGMEAFAWIIILSKELKGEARTGSFQLPPKVVNLIRQGKELGVADDIVFGQSNSKQKNGAVGLLTENAIDRSSYYEQAIMLALIPFKNKALYLTS